MKRDSTPGITAGFIWLLVLITLLSTGCAKQKMLLDEPGRLVLTAEREQIELTENDKLYLEWIDNGELFTTSAVFKAVDMNSDSTGMRTTY